MRRNKEKQTADRKFPTDKLFIHYAGINYKLLPSKTLTLPLDP